MARHVCWCQVSREFHVTLIQSGTINIQIHLFLFLSKRSKLHAQSQFHRFQPFGSDSSS